MYIYICNIAIHVAQFHRNAEVRNQLPFSLELWPSWTPRQTSKREETGSCFQRGSGLPEVVQLFIVNLEVKVVTFMNS